MCRHGAWLLLGTGTACCSWVYGLVAVCQLCAVVLRLPGLQRAGWWRSSQCCVGPAVCMDAWLSGYRMVGGVSGSEGWEEIAVQHVLKSMQQRQVVVLGQSCVCWECLSSAA